MKLLVQTKSLFLLLFVVFNSVADEIRPYSLQSQEDLQKISAHYYNQTTHLPNQVPGKYSDQDYVNKALDYFQYDSEYRLQNLGEIEKIDKDREIKFGKTKDKDFKINAYRLFSTNNHIQTVDLFYHIKANRPYTDINGRSHAKRPIVIISPSIKGIATSSIRGIEVKWAKEFAQIGIDTIILTIRENLFELNRPTELIDEWMRDQIVVLRRTIDLIEDQMSDRINLDSIGAMGASLGGIKTSILMGIEPTRIKCGVTILAAGNFPDLWVNAEQKFVKAYREHRLSVEKIPGHNLESKHKNLYQKIKHASLTDPIIFKNQRPTMSEDLLMWVSLSDKKVPAKNQIELWHQFGRPQVIVKDNYKGKHRSVIFTVTNFEKEKYIYFFNKRFSR